MSNKYEGTQQFWDKVFINSDKKVNPSIPIDNTKLEKSIEWISQGSKKLLDFGCGSGRTLLRSLFYGVEQVYGIDISKEAINRANENVKEHGLKEEATFNVGSMELLKAIEDNSYDGIVLYNIIDNIYPKDALLVLEEVHRIVKSKGKVLIKFNPYIEEELIKEYKFKEVENEFYEETTGLYLWNLTDERIKEILQQYFDIEEEITVEFPEHNQINRMYYLRNKKVQ